MAQNSNSKANSNSNSPSNSLAVCEEFNRLVSRSNELFIGLRDLPRFGVKQWQSQFVKTFDVYTKLWKFQQDKRFILEEHVGLKRHQIGEIASKVGQLYYHYYLHTSDVKYLFESLQFYSAINNRGYFSQQTGQEFDPHIAVKNLRYLARFLVVSFLVRDYFLINEVIVKLQDQAHDLLVLQTQDEERSTEDWSAVVKEARSFLACENFFSVLANAKPLKTLQFRIKKEDAWECSKDQNLLLQAAIVIGGCERQAKFSELTIDMYRMLLLLEYDIATQKASTESGVAMKNPSKFLLYKPSFQQLYAYFAAVFRDLQENRVMMLYISGDAIENKTLSSLGEVYSCGVATQGAAMPAPFKSKPKQNSFLLYPEDLIPFTRKPLFLIVDSSNSQLFATVPHMFGQPLMILMAPPDIPEHNRKRGSLFTLFLMEPLLALCQLCQLTQTTEDGWKHCKALMKKIHTQAIDGLARQSTISGTCLVRFLGDSILRNIIGNFVITWFVLRMLKVIDHLPTCIPTLPTEIVESKVSLRYILDIAETLNVRSLFHEITELAPLQ
ncbi:protein SCAI-like isoform X2 [Clytia hemisphaerica]|uniref:Protein SCAI n=2 Tax=Clytia hemisphaerica TaxID=252671 RepID=A0A7M5WL16_9CNID